MIALSQTYDVFVSQSSYAFTACVTITEGAFGSARSRGKTDPTQQFSVGERSWAAFFPVPSIPKAPA